MQNLIEWQFVGPALDRASVTRFEEEKGITIPEAVKLFLCTVSNGGRPTGTWTFKIQELEGGAKSYIHGINGLFHPDRCYSLDLALEVFPEKKDDLYFLGFDGLDGQIVVKTTPPFEGQVFYLPWDMKDDPLEDSLYKISDTFADFWLSLVREDA